MISQTTVTAIGPLVDRLAAANVALGVGERSILGACVQSAMTPQADHFEGNTGWLDAWQQSLMADTLTGATAHFAYNDENGDSTSFIPCSLHGQTMEEAADHIARMGIDLLATARNVVKPAILYVIDRVSEEVNNSATPIEPVEVIDVRMIDSWKSNVVTNLLSHYSSMRGTVMSRRDIPMLKMPEGLAEHMRTGNSGIDDAFQLAMVETGMSVEDVFSSLFGVAEDIGTYTPDWYIYRNRALVQLLFVAIASERPWTGSGMNNTQWSTLMNDLANALGGLCSEMMDRFTSDIKNNVLFIRTEGNRVFLVGEVYDRFLEAGGTPEVIIGKVITKDWTTVRSEDILGKKDGYLDGWRKWHAAQRYQEEASKVAAIRKAFYNAIAKFVDEGDGARQVQSPAVIKERAIDRCNGIMPSHCNDLGKAAIHIVCDLIYPGTPFKELILRIDELVGKGEDGEVAAGLAIAEFINDWLVAQVTYEKI